MSRMHREGRRGPPLLKAMRSRMGFASTKCSAPKAYRAIPPTDSEVGGLLNRLLGRIGPTPTFISPTTLFVLDPCSSFLLVASLRPATDCRLSNERAFSVTKFGFIGERLKTQGVTQVLSFVRNHRLRQENSPFRRSD